MRYEDIFPRVETPEQRFRTIDEFEGLQMRACPFTSNRGQRLAGYRYAKAGTAPKAVVIIAPGFGVGGQRVYLDVADCFASNGYLVFAYDSTGADESEGESTVGFPQGIIDLQHAIDFVKHDGEMGQLPTVLFGHSWGAYCVGAVLNVRPDVAAVVAVAGFDRTKEWFAYALAGGEGDFLSQIEPTERVLFGRYAEYTAADGFANTQAPVMVVQSADDRNVPLAVGYERYRSRFANDGRFAFRLYEDRGHLFIFYTDEARAYDRRCIDELEGTLISYGRSSGFDKSVGYAIDRDFFAEIIGFCDRCVGNSV